MATTLEKAREFRLKRWSKGVAMMSDRDCADFADSLSAELREENARLREALEKARKFIGQTEDYKIGSMGASHVVGVLTDAIAWANENFPLPRCRHGKALRDGAGEMLEPSCGCAALSKEKA